MTRLHGVKAKVGHHVRLEPSDVDVQRRLNAGTP